VIEAMQKPGTYEKLFSLGARLRKELGAAASSAGLRMAVSGFGSVTGIHFASGDVTRYEDLINNDARVDMAFRTGLLRGGIACSPAPLRRLHVTMSHTESDVDRVADVAESVLRDVKRNS
jgi:glutamate-1-semialdehyde 2,1-aminomutase